MLRMTFEEHRIEGRNIPSYFTFSPMVYDHLVIQTNIWNLYFVTHIILKLSLHFYMNQHDEWNNRKTEHILGESFICSLIKGFPLFTLPGSPWSPWGPVGPGKPTPSHSKQPSPFSPRKR